MGTKSGKPRFNCKRALLTLATYSKRPVDGIPRTQAEWDQVLIDQVKRKIITKNFSRSELRKVVRKSLQLVSDGDDEEDKIDASETPDNAANPAAGDKVESKSLPSCFDWNLMQVCDWLAANEFGYFQEAFQANGIAGKKLVTINSRFLISVGFSSFNDVQKLVKAIRNLLDLPLTSKTLEEIIWEKFLWKKSEPDTRKLTFSHYSANICTAFDADKWGEGWETTPKRPWGGALSLAP